MQLTQNHQVIPFQDADYGSLLLYSDGYQHVVFGMKAFSGKEDEKIDQLVAFGSLGEDENNIPTLHGGSDLQNTLVIDLSECCIFSPSLIPTEIVPSVTSGPESYGLAFILSDRILLGTRCWRYNRIPMVTYVNLATGAIEGAPSYGDFVATRRWRLMESMDNTPPKTLFEFEPDGINDKDS